MGNNSDQTYNNHNYSTCNKSLDNVLVDNNPYIDDDDDDDHNNNNNDSNNNNK